MTENAKEFVLDMGGRGMNREEANREAKPMLEKIARSERSNRERSKKKRIVEGHGTRFKQQAFQRH